MSRKINTDSFAFLLVLVIAFTSGSLPCFGKEHYTGSNPITICTEGRALPTLLSLDIANTVSGENDLWNNESNEDSSRWEVLFDGNVNTLKKWKSVHSDTFPSDVWKTKGNLLFVGNNKGGQDIITREAYEDFRLVFDFNLTYAANSGIKYLVNEIRNNQTGKWGWNGPEYQIIDDYNNPELEGDSGSTASLYLIYPPENKKLNPAGQWNHGEIIVRGDHIEQWLNGIKVVSLNRRSVEFRRKVALTKFKAYTDYGEAASGHIMLTDHGGDRVYFRNIKIKRL